MAQAPMIWIPKKGTDEVDWTTPVRNLVSQVYGENPDAYVAECAALQRCRQDAVRGAGSDITARDLLYKYFGQLELIELRFSEIRVTFPWRDAFTNKQITQTSIAYEKASIIFLIASTHSSIAASQSRSDPEGLKRAYHYFRTCAGMLTYINDNFLHAPSTDLSRDVVKFLVGLIMAQASEVFLEKCIDEKKTTTLISKLASHVAYTYTSLNEELKEFMGKGILDRNWVTVIQTKAKYFTSVCQYQRAIADDTAGKHGEALVRFTVAEAAAKEANRTANSFASLFVNQLSPNLPADAGPALQELTKAHLALCTEKKTEASKANDLIYNAVLPAAETLPVIEKTSIATPISIQEVYGNPDVQKVIGQDIFKKLVPLSVHESASVYSEEKAKLVRSEVEKTEGAESEIKTVLDSIGVRQGLARFKAIVEGSIGGEEEVPVDVRRWREDISVMEDREPVDRLLAQLNGLKEKVRGELEGASRDLEIESKDCEAMRLKHEHLWTQDPSASFTKNLRQDLKSHFVALEAAASSDEQVMHIWQSVAGDIRLLLSPQVEDIFRASTEQEPSSGPGESLLDLDVGSEMQDTQEKAKISQLVNEIEDRLSRLSKIGKERNEVLKDLKDKVQADDVSHLLLLNRRNTGVESTLFANELEKFRPYQQRLASTVHHEQVALQEVTALWKSLKDLAGRGPGARKWDEREKRKKATVNRFSHAREGYMEVRDGIAKGLQFYNELNELGKNLHSSVKSFVSSRKVERDNLASKLDTQKRLSVSSRPPPLAAKPPVPPPPQSQQQGSLQNPFASMNLRGSPQPTPNNYSWANSGPQSPSNYATSPPPPQQQQPQQVRGSYMPPPPPPVDPYANLGMLSNNSFSSTPQTPQGYNTPSQAPPGYSSPSPYQQSPPPPPQQQQQQQRPPPQQPYQPTRQQSYPPPPPQPQYGSFNHQSRPSQSGGGLPPPPPPVNYNSQQYGAPPPPQAYGSPPPPPQSAQGYQTNSPFPPPPPQQQNQNYGGSYGGYGR